MTEEQLDKYKELVEKATQETWDYRESTDKIKIPYIFLRPGYFFWPQMLDNEVTRMLKVKENFHNDAKFIAASRTIVPELIAEVQKLQEQIKQIREMLLNEQRREARRRNDY